MTQLFLSHTLARNHSLKHTHTHSHSLRLLASTLFLSTSRLHTHSLSHKLSRFLFLLFSLSHTILDSITSSLSLSYYYFHTISLIFFSQTLSLTIPTNAFTIVFILSHNISSSLLHTHTHTHIIIHSFTLTDSLLFSVSHSLSILITFS